ncbi:peptidoglycan binding domain containing protein [Fusarium oxysporum f. sp. phaseoli]
MAPRIVVLCDGTWCGRETSTKTNIFAWPSFFKSPSTTPIPRIHYLFDGATASDLKGEVISAYQFIVDNYTPDHEIWLFGLSRGAYTVRSVAGLINNYGIINRWRLNLNDDETHQMCQDAYVLYKNRDRNNKPHGPDSIEFRQRNSWPLIGDPVPNGESAPQPPVRFMGLFDTVGSLGIPTFTGGLGLNYLQFYDDVVSSVVMNVCHLVSVHDRLWAFQPCLAKRKNGGKLGIYEEWLPGCHYDLGRQEFRFWRSGGGVLEKLVNIASYIPPSIQRYTFRIKETTMNVRFVDDPERDPAVLHRRRLQANRTRNYRRRTKANRNIQATYDQAELLPKTVDSESESEQTGPDAGGFRQDEPLSSAFIRYRIERA